MVCLNSVYLMLGLSKLQVGTVLPFCPIFTILTQHYAPFVYKSPPYYLHEFAAEVYLPPKFTPPLASATLTNERKVRTHHTTLYMKSSYLLASDTPTK